MDGKQPDNPAAENSDTIEDINESVDPRLIPLFSRHLKSVLPEGELQRTCSIERFQSPLTLPKTKALASA